MSIFVTSASTKSSHFTFSAQSKDLEATMTKVASVLNTSSDNKSGSKNFFILSQEKKILVIGYTSDTMAAAVVPNAVAHDKEGIIGIDHERLAGVIKGRAVLDYKFNGNELEFKATKGQYSGKIVLLPITKDQVTYLVDMLKPKKEKDVKETLLSKEVLAKLKEGVALSSVVDLHTDQALLSHITITDSSITVFTFDSVHFGHYTSKLSKGRPIQMAMPTKYFPLLNRMVEEDKVRVYLRPKSIEVHGESFVMQLPSVHTKADNYQLIPDYLASLKPDAKLELDVEVLSALIANMVSLHTANSTLNFSYSDKEKLKVTFSTANGSASDSLKVKPITFKAINAKVDPNLVKDLIRLIKVKGKVTMSIQADKMLALEYKDKGKGTAVTLVTSLV
jgi:hypothetical protein